MLAAGADVGTTVSVRAVNLDLKSMNRGGEKKAKPSEIGIETPPPPAPGPITAGEAALDRLQRFRLKKVEMKNPPQRSSRRDDVNLFDMKNNRKRKPLASQALETQKTTRCSLARTEMHSMIVCCFSRLKKNPSAMKNTNAALYLKKRLPRASNSGKA